MPDFDALYNNIQYKQRNRPSIPKQHLLDTKAPAGMPASKGAGVLTGQPTKKPLKPSKDDNKKTPEHLVNPAFDEDIMKPLGILLGRVALFLKKIAPAGKSSTVPPRNATNAVLCLNYHTKGHCWSHCDHTKSQIELSTDKKTQLIQFLKKGLEKIK
jgi:hypothetical protein